ncbi:MAG: hypothetical protein CMI54_08650 [Parcubacteria group bacterium]|nr:hypothetical protein [Parcubacteria group bacterium]|tara:strand:- start:2930 stop:3277 length:348 start_codon:yes stop_codon:yes gene_type:complete
MGDALKVCVQCGRFYTILTGYFNDLYCKQCHGMRMAAKSKYKADMMRAKGIIPESRRRAGRRAYHTRLARLYFLDKTRFKRLHQSLRGQSPGRAGAVTRKINLIKKDINNAVHSE